MESVYTLLEVERAVPEVYGSIYDVRELLKAIYYMGDKKTIDWIGYTELDRKDKVCILKETHWRNLSCQRAERDAVTQMNLNIKS